MAAQTGECIAKPVFAIRLEQIIEGVGFEGPDCILFESRYENNKRLRCTGGHSQGFQAILPRHPDVEKCHIHGPGFQHFRGRSSIAAFSDNLNIVFFFEQA